MPGNQRFPTDRIIVFTRYPVPGQTKTRPIPMLGPAGAADLQRRLTVETRKKAAAFARTRGIGVEACYEGGTDRQMRRWLGSQVSFSPQAPGDLDLGSRMYQAFQRAFQSGCGRAVLVGTDIPRLKPDHFMQAFEALGQYDLVLGPSRDGGYWLMGLNRLLPLFQGIEWGTGQVYEQTLALAADQGLKVRDLEILTDLDTGENLEELLPDQAGKGPYLSVIIPALNEERTVERALKSALSPDAEIILVDGGSSDDTVLRARNSGAKIVNSPRGRALQQNRGASESRGRVLLFLHADTRLPPDYVQHIFELLMDPEVVAGAFRFRTDLDQPLMRFIEMGANLRSRYLGLPYGDQGLFFRKEVFEAENGFPQVPIAEDLLMMHRIRRMGRTGLVPAHVITSARRWKKRGFLSTTLINQVVVAGSCLGVSPEVLWRLYRVSGNRVRKKMRKKWIS